MKKLLNKRGSVLFLVVVVMALLLVAASATYYVVRNQHASANVHYNSEQSYQTAYSVNKTVEQYLTIEQANISADPSTYTGSLFEKMMGLKTGEMLTASNDLKQYGLGDYDIVITKTPESTTSESVFEITTRSDVNGETAAVTQVWKVESVLPPSKYFTRFLVATGYRDEDVFLTANHIFGDVYFENPFTSAGNTTYRRSVYCSGNLLDNGVRFNEGETEGMEIVVAKNYYSHSAENETRMNKINALFVGGDCEVGDDSWNGKEIVAKAVYVMGDYRSNLGTEEAVLFIKGDCYINAAQNKAGTIYYVNGDLYIAKNPTDPYQYFALGDTQFFVKGDVYFYEMGTGNPKPTTPIKCWGTLHDYTKNSEAGSVVELVKKESEDSEDEDLENDDSEDEDSKIEPFPLESAMAEISGDTLTDWLSVQQYISEKSAKNVYVPWNAESYFDETFPDAPTIMLSDSERYDYSDEDWWTKLDWSKPDPYEDMPKTGRKEVKVLPDGQYVITIQESCIIQPAEGWEWGHYYIVIEATNDPIYIKLDSNGVKFGSDGLPSSTGKDTFIFGTANTYNGATTQVSVLVKGTHPVIFILPDGTDFNMTNYTFIGHADLALALTGYTSVDDLINDKVVVATNLKSDRIARLLPEDPTKSVVIDNSNPLFSGLSGITSPHNNIFFVTTGMSNNLNFGAGDYTFCGYIYAPGSTLQIDTSSRSLSFLGGLIVGSYYYMAQNAELIYADPCDPYDAKRGSNIVAKLMEECNGTKDKDKDKEDEEDEEESEEDTEKVASPVFAGYK